MKIKVLFICHGNICRSPMAEFVLKDMVRKDKSLAGIQFNIESAATSTEELGNDIYPPAKAKMLERGIHFEKRRARQMKKADYERFDYLIGMDDANIRNAKRICGFQPDKKDPECKIYKLLDFAGKNRNVADPWYTGDFEATYQDVTAGCRAFLEHLKKR